MRAARSAALLLSTLLAALGVATGAGGRAHAAPAPIEDVLLTDVGGGFVIVEESTNAGLSRTYTNDDAAMIVTGFAVTTPPGVEQIYETMLNINGGPLELIPELGLAAWVLAPGAQPEDESVAMLVMASRDHFFTFVMQTDGTGATDPRAFLIDLARRQLAAAGGTANAEAPPTEERRAEEAELIDMLPAAVPAEYGITELSTSAGRDEFGQADDVDVEVATFLTDNTTSAIRLWSDPEALLIAVVNVTRYPYDLFAAASVHHLAAADDREVITEDALPDVADVVAYRDTVGGRDEVGTVFRRGDVVAIAVVQRADSVPEETAAALAADLTRLTAERLPRGDTAPYDFPEAPSKLLGLALTAAIVTGAAAGSAVIARLRARRVRRQWTGGELPPPEWPDTRRGVAIALDRDAQRLRRQGGIVAVGQLLAVNVGIVALAGDFGWAGVGVAAAALVGGLLLTHLWQRHELGLLGAKAPPRELVVPRPAGVIVGVLALVVLGFGVAYLLKGLRYIVLKPTLAQMKWSDWLGVAPRTVGVIFAVGGFVVAVLGGWLFRVARALGRARTKRRLELDPRPAALYLRSFEDDNLPLPAIASARRPLFELFSLRGADPFEESVAWELNTYGPVVAVGRPGRTLASLGAAREHLPDETWRDQVAARMEAAGIIAVATGETDGLAWELGQVVNGGHLGKTFFVFPPVAPDELGRRWQHTAASLEDAGQAVGPLPVPASRVHTVRLDADGTCTVTYAERRDEATYRTAVDRTVTAEPVGAAP